MNTVAIITHEEIGPRMTGPGIRALELARAMAPEVRARLVSPQPVGRDVGPIEVRQYRFGDDRSMADAVAGADVLLVQGFTLHKFPRLAADGRPVVVDLYCPFQLENLEWRRHAEADAGAREHGAAVDRAVLLQQLGRGDFFLCASERQRDFWLGMLAAAGRLSAAAYHADQTGDRLIAVVPFGVDARPPAPGPPAVRGVHPGVGAGDRLALWGGSITDWQDPVTAIRATRRATAEIPDLRLLLPAGIPNPEIPPMRALEHARAEAAALHLLDRHVLFVDWVPYDGRGALFAECNIGVSAHAHTLETRYAWRTRILDYIWAALPIVCTRGDALAEMVERKGLGVVVDPGDAEAMGDAFVRILGDETFATGCRQRLAAERAALEWGRVAEPLRRYCQAPRRTAPSAGAPAVARWPLARLSSVLRRRLRG